MHAKKQLNKNNSKIKEQINTTNLTKQINNNNIKPLKQRLNK